MRVSAPGKILILGEYAVVQGGNAVIAAVDRRAVGRWQQGGKNSDVVESVLQVAVRMGSAAAGNVHIDTSAFRDALRQKLGIGASAAVAAITAFLVTGKADARTLELAVNGHREAAGGIGSGVDVAACFHGGVIACPRQPGPVEKLVWPESLKFKLLFTKKSASTRALVSAATAAPRWPQHAQRLAELAELGIEAFREGDTGQFIDVADTYGAHLEALGQDAGVPIVPAEVSKLRDAARQVGCAVKTSGAGGGDVVLAFGQDDETLSKLAAATDFEEVVVDIDHRGVGFD